MSAQLGQAPTSALPDELWIRSFSFLSTEDLFALGNASRQSQLMSSDDSLWEPHCRRRWEGKQNVGRFLISKGGCGEECNAEILTCCSDVVRQFCTARSFGPTAVAALLALNMGFLIRRPKSWKEAYIMAEMDSRRQVISSIELVHFKWQLIYGGSPSRTGLRQFNANGTYSSPYLGTCEWVLHGQTSAPEGATVGQYLSFGGITLLVERDAKTWGWIVGKGQRTEYRSVDPRHQGS